MTEDDKKPTFEEAINQIIDDHKEEDKNYSSMIDFARQDIQYSNMLNNHVVEEHTSSSS